MTQNHDLTPILATWHYRPGHITVRTITGIDGKPKIQMRLQLGILQMETTGRPDGQRPHGCESLLEYYTDLLEKARTQGKHDDFHLTETDCADLRDEATMYYYRYLSLFELQDYAGVIRDTDRNLKVFDLIKTYAKSTTDRFSLEQHRPYVIMMNSRSRSALALAQNDLAAAYNALQEGMQLIEKFFADFGQPRLAPKTEEYRLLRSQADLLRDRLPRDPLEVLRDKLANAVREERFEEAARLRDKIRKLEDRP